MTNLAQDIRYAARRLAASRWFTAAAILTLALGIGANAAVFTFVNAVLLRGLPFDDPDRIVSIWTENAQGQQIGVSYPDYRDWRDESRSFEAIGAYLGSTINISEESVVPEQVSGAYVTGNFFDVIGEDPIMGRGFFPADDVEGAEPVVLIGHSIWRGRYAEDPGVLGRTIRVNSKVATIVGVMPEGMRFPNNNDLWIPRQNLPPQSEVENRGTRSFNAVGRLAAGTTPERAREELAIIGRRLAQEYPATNADLTPDLLLFSERMNGPEIRTIFLSLLGAVAFVLLIACANVANLLLARAARRSREIAVRVSLGATRARIVRQLLVESVLLAVVAGLVGLVFANFGIRWFDANTQDVGKPYWMEFTLDGSVFLYILFVSAATVLLSGLAPALHVSGTDVNSLLKDGGRGGSTGVRSRRWAGALAIGQVVMTLVLLSGATFMMRSFLKLYSMDLGVDTSRLLTMNLYLPLTQYPDPEPRMRIFEEFERRLATVNEFEASALTTALPLAGGGVGPLEIDGVEPLDSELMPQVTAITVSPRYFDTIDLALLQGRAFVDSDGASGAETAIVNQRFADLHLGGNPLGRRVRLAVPPGVDPAPWMTVVGLAPNIRQRALEEVETDPIIYRPLRADPARAISLLVRTRSDPENAVALVRETLRPIDPDLPLFDVMTLDQRLAVERWPFRVFGMMFSAFAAFALLLSAIGLYSLTAHSVIQRTQEFGIRMSLGARPTEIARLAVRRALIHLAIGLPIGILGALAVGQLLQSLLVQMSPTDPVTILIVVGLLVGVVVLACLQPARRASRLDPVIALRAE